MTIQLPKTTITKKRLGRGIGSGKGGHTAGRGQKGQKARGKIGILFEGVKIKKSLFKRLPLQRGRGKFGPRTKPIIVKLSYLNILPAGAEVNLANLAKYGIVKMEDAAQVGVKILGDGEVTKKFTVGLPISKSAAKEIEKAGGKIAKAK